MRRIGGAGGGGEGPPGAPPAQRVATYRVQLGAGCGFADLAARLDYLAELGISHVYCSPILQAGAGSTHGYDVVDPTRISAELGGEAGLRLLTGAAERHGLRLLLDVVPNHMSVADRRNRWWWDVLVTGRGSPFAGYFDVNWDHPLVRDRVMAPLLGEPLETALASGSVRLAVEDGVVVACGPHRLPLSRETLAGLLSGTAVSGLAARLRDAEFVEDRWRLAAELAAELAAGPARAEVEHLIDAVNRDPSRLRGLLEAQHYVLTHWKEATVVLNYRRFFDITSLIGVRVEDPVVLDATHARVDALLDAGVVDGVRVDHIDGLRQPRRYLERMRARHPRSWLLVEKILGPGESLPAEWPVDGTTGYEFAALAGGLFIDPAGWDLLRRRWAEATGHPDDFAEITRHAKLEVMSESLSPMVDTLVRMLSAVSRQRGRDALADDAARIRTGVTEYLIGLDVYRTYIESADQVPHPPERRRIAQALDRAAAAGGDPETLALIGDVLLSARTPGVEQDFVLRLQQTSTVIAAKGTEDTAFYRFPALSAACEVGGDPGRPAVDVATFHAANRRRQELHPESLLATSTHDTKRSEDVRARLYLLSEVAQRWAEMTRRWREWHAPLHRDAVPGRTMAELLYQTVVGAWPVDADRLTAYMVKAASEAKQRTSWVAPDDAYREQLAAFVRSLLADGRFTREVDAFVSELRRPAEATSLAMTLLRLTAPGVPDTYQGTELWQLTLVDPDNRHPVDYARRVRLLAALDGLGGPAAWSGPTTELAKLFLIRSALQLRRRRPHAFGREGDYRDLRADGDRADHVVAFARGAGPEAITVCPRLVHSLRGGWGDTSLALPRGAWVNLMDNSRQGGRVSLAALLRDFPVALLERAGGASGGA